VGRDLNLGPPEYEAGVLITQLRRSIRKHVIISLTVHEIPGPECCLKQSHSAAERCFKLSNFNFARLGFIKIGDSDSRLADYETWTTSNEGLGGRRNTTVYFFCLNNSKK
jgi:hypothetical protein